MAGVNQSLYTVIQGEEWNKYIYELLIHKYNFLQSIWKEYTF